MESNFSLCKIVEKEDREPTNTDDDIDEKNVELFDSFDIESLPLDIMKRENPWDISSIYDLAYFCCPECDYKHQDKQDFVSHASSDHPWVSLEQTWALFEALWGANWHFAAFCGTLHCSVGGLWAYFCCPECDYVLTNKIFGYVWGTF